MHKVGGRSNTQGGGSDFGAASSAVGAVGKRTVIDEIGAPPVQRTAVGPAPEAPTEVASRGVQGAGGPLPHLAQIQSSFGRHDVSGVQAHQDGAVSSAAGALGARAFAVGNNVGFDGSPDLHTAAHEAAHVVQQRGGVQLKGGIDQPGDSYERHADAVADAVVAGRSAEALLDQHSGQHSGGGGGAAVQRKPTNTTKTPDGLPDPAPAETIAPPSTEDHVDAEGNKILERNGHWYLAGPPKAVSFPIAPGYKPELLPINPNASYAALHSRTLAIQAEQLAIANGMKGDMKYWFAKVYYFVTTHELEAIDAGTYLYPHMKMQEVAQFQAAYKVNLENWKAGNKDKVEAHWKKAFGAAESEQGGTWYKPRSMELMNALLPSMQAHIRFDLPRAIAACYVTHYSGIPGVTIGDFRSDFDGMGPVFDKSQSSLLGEIKDDTWIIDPGRFGPMQDLGFPFIFNVPLERDHTFEKATELSKSMRNGDSNKDFTKRMRTLTKAAHPNSGSDDFDVDGDDVGSDVDWMHQPGLKTDKAAPAPTYEPAPAPPTFPEKLFFKQGRGQGDDKLEQAIRDDQDLAPYKALAEWTRKVRGAELYFEGHASQEGTEVDNANLAGSRAFLVKFFMWHCGADAEHNTFNDVGKGAGPTPTPEWRHVVVRVVKAGTGRQQHNTPNANLPPEAKP